MVWGRTAAPHRSDALLRSSAHVQSKGRPEAAGDLPEEAYNYIKHCLGLRSPNQVLEDYLAVM